MAKASTFEKRLASLEKTITDFFLGSSTKPAKKRATKRKAAKKTAQKSAKKTAKKKTAKRKR